MPTLSERARDRLDDDKFAYVDASGEGHLPINDEGHVRAAMGRWNQTEFESKAAKERARKKILKAAEQFDIDVDEDAKVSSPTKSLRPAQTKAGPRGGKAD